MTVARNSFFKLAAPKCLAAFRAVAIFTPFVPMPKTAIHKYGCSPFWKDDIRGAWEFSCVDSEAQTSPMEKRPNDQLRAGVSSADAAHIPASTLFGERVHGAKGQRCVRALITAAMTGGDTALPSSLILSRRVPYSSR